ncbi:MAG TPA: hypothetical protein VGT44_06370 [Ktedonobacteraceae bacterium]|nr:hypothetical protein [Ktedonobacteraceae bacterium]
MNREQANARLQEVVASKFVPVYASSKAEVIASYRERYEGGRGAAGWKQHLIKDLAAQTGMKPKNLEKRFDPARIDNAPRRASEKAQYATLGKEKLPPIGQKLPGNQITITVRAQQAKDFVGGKPVGWRDRAWTATFSGPDAYAFAGAPSFRDVWRKHDYPKDVIDLLDGDGDYGAEITAVV